MAAMESRRIEIQYLQSIRLLNVVDPKPPERSVFKKNKARFAA